MEVEVEVEVQERMRKQCRRVILSAHLQWLIHTTSLSLSLSLSLSNNSTIIFLSLSPSTNALSPPHLLYYSPLHHTLQFLLPLVLLLSFTRFPCTCRGQAQPAARVVQVVD